MALGIILGPMADLNFRRGILAGKGSFLPFVTRPISLIIILTMAVVIFYPMIKRRMQMKKARAGQGSSENAA